MLRQGRERCLSWSDLQQQPRCYYFGYHEVWKDKIMSNWTKGFIGVAIASQVVLFVILLGCIQGDSSYHISNVDMFGIILASLCTLVYIPAILVSYDSDQVRKKLDEQLQA
jgi:hypothetical protein